MTDKDLKFLKKLVAFCRKSGIDNFNGFGLNFSLKDQEVTKSTFSRKPSKPSQATSPANDPFVEVPTEEELLFWSADNSETAASKES